VKLSPYYERPEIWDASTYTTGYNRDRLLTAVDMVPTGTESLLDVGSGNGAFLHFLEQKRPEIAIKGLEPSQQAINNRLCRAEIVRADLEALPFQAGSFDVVSTLEVLEHIPAGQIPTATSEIARVGRSSILLGLPYRERRTRIRCPECGCGFDPHQHLRTYDDEAAAKLFPGMHYTRKTVLKGQQAIIPYIVLRVLRLEISADRFPKAVCPQCNWHGATNPEAAPADGPANAPTLARRIWQMQPQLSIDRNVMWLVQKPE
jgi:SAM-dependent methyltransferase